MESAFDELPCVRRELRSEQFLLVIRIVAYQGLDICEGEHSILIRVVLIPCNRKQSELRKDATQACCTEEGGACVLTQLIQQQPQLVLPPGVMQPFRLMLYSQAIRQIRHHAIIHYKTQR